MNPTVMAQEIVQALATYDDDDDDGEETQVLIVEAILRRYTSKLTATDANIVRLMIEASVLMGKAEDDYDVSGLQNAIHQCVEAGEE